MLKQGPYPAEVIGRGTRQDSRLCMSTASSSHLPFGPSFCPHPPLQPDPHPPMGAKTPRTLLWTLDNPVPSSSTSQTWAHNWDCREMRDLIAIWGEEEFQHQFLKGHHNRDIFKCIAQQIQVWVHNRDWLQWCAKTKVIKSPYHHMHDARTQTLPPAHPPPPTPPAPSSQPGCS